MNKESKGVYTEQLFNFNPKCVIFSIIVCIAYWVLPADRNIFLLPVLFGISYIGMSWYDFMYNCDYSLFSGKNILGVATYTSIFKPQNIDLTKVSEEDQRSLIQDATMQQHKYLQNVYLFHITSIFPLLFYLGYYGGQADSRAFGATLAISGIGMLYHVYRLFSPRIRLFRADNA